MSEFLDSIRDVKKNYNIYDEWEQKQADDKAKRQYLAKNLELPVDKVELTKAKAEVVIRASDLLDKRSEDNCENTERTTGIIIMGTTIPFSFFSFIPLICIKKGKPLSKKLANIISFGSVFASLASMIGLLLWSNSKQKEASRVGRFQAKQHELKDAKNFVIYTPEQIEAAKIIAKDMPDKKDDKSLSKLFQNMEQMSQDKKLIENGLKKRLKILKILKK